MTHSSRRFHRFGGLYGWLDSDRYWFNIYQPFWVLINGSEALYAELHGPGLFYQNLSTPKQVREIILGRKQGNLL